MNHQPFIDEILQNPDDDDPRLIYADWLSENGNPRGEFIRIQCRRAQLPFYEREYWELRLQEKALLAKHESEWAGDIPDLVYHFLFHRGFPSRIRIYSDALVKFASKIKSITPIEDLLVDFSRTGQLERLCASDALQGITSLSVGQFYGNTAIDVLGDCPFLGNLTKFRAQFSINNTGIEKLFSQLKLDNLKSLCLKGDNFSWAQFFALAKLPELRSLRITGTDGTNTISSLTGESSIWKQLEHLSLDLANLPSSTIDTFAKNGTLNQLVSLESRLTDQIQESLLPELSELRSLSDGPATSWISPATGTNRPFKNTLSKLRVLSLGHAWSQSDVNKLVKQPLFEQLFAFGHNRQNISMATAFKKGVPEILMHLDLPVTRRDETAFIDKKHGTSLAPNRDVNRWFEGVEPWSSQIC